MLLLRMAGLQYKHIAAIFNCDVSTVYHHCKKYGIEPKQNIIITPFIISVISKRPEQEVVQHIQKIEKPNVLVRKYAIPIEKDNSQWYSRDNGERVNKGFDYKDYLKKI
jgi:hypothetical protein